jgi:thiol reductant ABC exporter CydD subunit
MAGALDRRLTAESGAARWQLTIAGILGGFDAGLIVAEAVLLAAIIARAALHHAGPAALTGQLIALGGVLAGRAGVRAGFELSGRRGASRVMSELRGRLTTRLIVDAPGARPAQLRTGDLAASAVAGVDALEGYFASYLPQLMLAGIVPPVVLVWVAAIDPLAAGILAVTVPILIGFMILVGKGTQAQTHKRHAALALLSAHFLDVVSGLATLRSYRREAAQRETLAGVGERYRRETMGTLRMAFMSALVLELCAMLGTAVVAATIGVELCAGALTLQAGLTVLILAPELYGPLREVGQQFHAGADASAAAGRIFVALDETPSGGGDTEITPAAMPDPRTQAISFEAIGFAYPGADALALDGLHLRLEPGTTTVLQGPSGAGKTTIARLLMGFAYPTAGMVRCGGQDLRDVDRERWRAQIAWLSQTPTVFSATVAENVRMGADGCDVQSVAAALEAAGADRFVRELPDGIHTLIGEGGRRLSAGQRRRIALARAFLRDAPLLILDEPTAHLDAGTAAEIAHHLTDLVRGRTVLLIVHDDSLTGLADQELILEAGQARARHSGALPATIRELVA